MSVCTVPMIEAAGTIPTRNEVIAGRQAGAIGTQRSGRGDTSGNRDLWLYRDRTVALLRRFLRMSVEVGRLPSLLGREFFRTHVTSYRAGTFQDAVIFVLDVERSLEQLSDRSKALVSTVVLEEFTQEEASRVLGCSVRTISRSYPEALDEVSEIFLRRGILTPLPTDGGDEPGCQEWDDGERDATSTKQLK